MAKEKAPQRRSNLILPAVAPLCIRGSVNDIRTGDNGLILGLQGRQKQKIVVLVDSPEALNFCLAQEDGKLVGHGPVADALAESARAVQEHRRKNVEGVCRFRLWTVLIFAPARVTHIGKKVTVPVWVETGQKTPILREDQRTGIPVTLELADGSLGCRIDSADFSKVLQQCGETVILHGSKIDLVDDPQRPGSEKKKRE